MDNNFFIFNSGNEVKVCSSVSLDEAIEWLKNQIPGKEWQKVKVGEVCYQDQDRKHFTFKVQKSESFIKKLADIFK